MWKPRRIYAIGDVHGHYRELRALYEQIVKNAYDSRLDQIVLLGDMVDNGPDTKLVLDQCMEWERNFNTPTEKRFIFLYGNHEDLMVDALSADHPIYGDYYLWWNQGGRETLKSYQPEGFSDFEKAIMQPMDYLSGEHVEWIKQLPYFYETPDYFFVHGGLPNEPLETIRKRAIENDPKLFYTMIWIRDEFILSPFSWGKKIIYAHTPTAEPLVSPNKIGLNTMPRNDGKLTALEIPSLRFFFQPKI